MATLLVRPKARIDLAEIWDFIAGESEVQADTFINRMTDELRLLARQPELGRKRDDLMSSLRSFPFGRYVIFYRIDPNGIEVIRVLHSARDVGAQFRSKDE